MIKVINLKKKYVNKCLALNDVSFCVNYGDFFSLLGKNGAGKTTAINILVSLVSKTSGKIYINGYDMDFDVLKIKSLIGFVSQEYNFSLFETVLDVVLNQAGYYGVSRFHSLSHAEYLLKKFDLWEKRDDTCLTLSGGMKRRLMIVKSLIHNPKILILDEPTAGVDIFSRKLIWDFLKELNKNGVTIILTTHYLEEVEILCNRVAIIDKGNLLMDVNIKDLSNFTGGKIVTFKVNSYKEFLSLSKLTDYKFNLSSDNVVDVSLLKHQSLNDLFKSLTDVGIIVYDIVNKDSELERLFFNLIV